MNTAEPKCNPLVHASKSHVLLSAPDESPDGSIIRPRRRAADTSSRLFQRYAPRANPKRMATHKVALSARGGLSGSRRHAEYIRGKVLGSNWLDFLRRSLPAASETGG